MKVKFYDNKGFKNYYPFNPEYSVLEVYVSQENKKEDFSRVSYILYTPTPKHHYKEGQSLLQARGYINLKYLEIVTPFIPPNWQFVETEKGVYLLPACFYVGWFNDYLAGVKEAVDLVDQEGPRTLAYDCYKDMKAYFAAELLEFIESKLIDNKPIEGWTKFLEILELRIECIDRIRNWAKIYDLEFLQKMYGNEVNGEIVNLLRDLQEQQNITEDYLFQLKRILIEWLEKGSNPLPESGEDFARKIFNKEYMEKYLEQIVDEIITDPEIILAVRKIGHRIEDYRRRKYEFHEEKQLKRYWVIENIYTGEELTEFRVPI